MALTVDVYKCGHKLGSGSMTGLAATSITGYSGTAPKSKRNVRIVVTAGALAAYAFTPAWSDRVSVDGGATLTMTRACPYSAA